MTYYDFGPERFPVCSKNIEHVVMRSEKYDDYACLQCNEWLYKPCTDPGCEFCKNRPERPKEL